MPLVLAKQESRRREFVDFSDSSIALWRASRDRVSTRLVPAAPCVGIVKPRRPGRVWRADRPHMDRRLTRHLFSVAIIDLQSFFRGLLTDMEERLSSMKGRWMSSRVWPF
jgi:hypothetical protein